MGGLVFGCNQLKYKLFVDLRGGHTCRVPNMMMRRFRAFLLILAVSTLYAPSGRAQSPVSTPTINPLGVLCPAGGCVDDPEQRSIIEGFKAWIRDALHGGQNLAERLVELIQKLIGYLRGVLGQLHQQTEASKCHNPDCSQYGVPTPTPG
jgi:hypothetical protein